MSAAGSWGGVFWRRKRKRKKALTPSAGIVPPMFVMPPAGVLIPAKDSLPAEPAHDWFRRFQIGRSPDAWPVLCAVVLYCMYMPLCPNTGSGKFCCVELITMEERNAINTSGVGVGKKKKNEGVVICI